MNYPEQLKHFGFVMQKMRYILCNDNDMDALSLSANRRAREFISPRLLAPQESPSRVSPAGGLAGCAQLEEVRARALSHLKQELAKRSPRQRFLREARSYKFTKITFLRERNTLR